MTAIQHNSVKHSICALILAAGKGTRMKSKLPKVLHPIMGRPMLDWVIGAVRDAGAAEITLVLSSETATFADFLSRHADIRVAIQEGQRGTGDAVASAASAFVGQKMPSYARGRLERGSLVSSPWVLVTAGDTPAISASTIRAFAEGVMNSGKKLGVLGMNLSQPKGYGRLLRDSKGGLNRIVEEKDASPEERSIALCNTGIIMAHTSWLFELLQAIEPNNSQNEYYLTDIFSLSASRGEPAHVYESPDGREFAGVNDRVQLDASERFLLGRRREALMVSGVTFHLPETVYLDGSVEVEEDAELGPNVTLQRNTKIGRAAKIGAGAVLMDAMIGGGSVVGPGCVLTNCRVAAGSVVPAGTVRSGIDF